MALTYGPFLLGLAIYACFAWSRRKSRSSEKIKPEKKSHDLPPKSSVFSVFQRFSTHNGVKIATNTADKGEGNGLSMSGLFKRRTHQEKKDATETTQVV
jgi:hypothetical protein